MSFVQQVNAFLAPLDNPRAKMDVMRTLIFLRDLYAQGKVELEQLRRDFREICRDVLMLISPNLTEEEVRERADQVAEELVKRAKVEATLSRLMVRYAPRL